MESPSLPVQGVFSCTSNLLVCGVYICRNFTLFLIALRRSRTEPPLYDLNFRRSAKEINVCFDAGSCSCWPQKKCMFMRCSYIETHHMIWINAVVTRKNCQNWDPVLSCPCKPGITENSLLFWQDTICYLSEEEQWCAPSSPSSPPLFLLFLTAWLLDHLKLLSLSGHWRPGRDTPVIFSCIPKHFPVISNYSFWPPDNGGDSTLGQIRCKE